MATEKQIAMQITSTKNIRKITASMKMVSAAKLKGDEKRMNVARPFNGWTSALVEDPQLIENATFEELPQRCLIVPFTSERGLCGGINGFTLPQCQALCSRHSTNKRRISTLS
jgi:F-type H+-transporting ATPase subunit gamma